MNDLSMAITDFLGDWIIKKLCVDMGNEDSED